MVPGKLGSQGCDQGDLGPQGPQGKLGDPGPPGLSDYEIVHATEHCLLLFETCSIIVLCPGGKSVLGGGVSTDPLGVVPIPAVVVQSYPFATLGWFATATNHDLFTTDVTAWAICATT